jgi:hypothetical protein
MLHRHLNHSEWTLAAIDDIIARGRMDDWKELRDAAASHPEIQERILRVCKPYLCDPYEQRYHFWNFYVRKELASVVEAEGSREFITAFESILPLRRTAYEELAQGPEE